MLLTFPKVVWRAQDTPSRGFIDDKNEIKGIDPIGFDLVTIGPEIVRSFDNDQGEKANSDAPVFVTPTRTPEKVTSRWIRQPRRNRRNDRL